MEKILIIGGCGYIGSKLYQYLQSANYSVETIDLEWFGNYSNPANMREDYRYYDTPIYKDFDVIILLAGHSSVPMCLNNALPCFHNNVANFVDLLGKLSPQQRFIYASSSSVYGNVGENTVNEDWHEYIPTNHYDLSKKEIDLYAALSGLDYYGLRLGTVNGPSPNLRVDIMINKMFHTAKQTKTIEIVNPHIHRPILSIYDLCRAVEIIITGPKAPGVYNLASMNVTVQQIADSVSWALGVPIVDKGTTPAYNFSIDTGKFCKVFDFQFQESAQSIVGSLLTEYSFCHPSDRTKARFYV